MWPTRLVKNSLNAPFVFIKKPTPTVPAPYDPLFEAFMLVEKIEAVQTSTKGVEWRSKRCNLFIQDIKMVVLSLEEEWLIFSICYDFNLALGLPGI